MPSVSTILIRRRRAIDRLSKSNYRSASDQLLIYSLDVGASRGGGEKKERLARRLMRLDSTGPPRVCESRIFRNSLGLESASRVATSGKNGGPRRAGEESAVEFNKSRPTIVSINGFDTEHGERHPVIRYNVPGFRLVTSMSLRLSEHKIEYRTA